MPPKPRTKKQPAVKAALPKPATRKSSSAQKASGTCVPGIRENCLPASTTLASTPSSGTRTGALLAPDNSIPTRDLSPSGTDTVTTQMTSEVAVEMTILRGKSSTYFVHAPLISFSFLAQLAATRQELKAVRARAAGSCENHPRIERPDKIKSLQAAMSLMDDSQKYTDFRVRFHFFFLTKHTVTESRIP